MKYFINDFIIEIEKNCLEKIYFKNNLLFTKVNFFISQNDIIKKILKEKDLSFFIKENLEWQPDFFSYINYKKNKRLTIIYENSFFLKEKINVSFEVNFYVNKNDLILETNLKTSERLFWGTEISLEFGKKPVILIETIEETDFIGENKNKIIFEEDKNIFITIDDKIKSENVKIQSSFKNFISKNNEIIFSSQRFGKKSEILKDNQTLNTNKNLNVIRIKRE